MSSLEDPWPDIREDEKLDEKSDFEEEDVRQLMQ